MKGKKTVYFLLPVVLAIWALIGWKVYAAMKEHDPVPVKKEAGDRAAVAKELPDSFVLVADYRDPFLDKTTEPVRPKQQAASHPAQPKKETLKEAPSWPKLGYYGLVKRNGDQKAVGFFSVDGTSFFVQNGEMVAELKVVRLWKDSVEVERGKERRIVRK